MALIQKKIKNGDIHDYRKQIKQSLWNSIEKVIDSVFMILDEEHGTVVCISKKGYVLTCHHCLDRKKKLTLISKNGIIYTAKKLFSNKQMDLALLIIQGTNQIPFSIISSTKSLPQQKAFCIGNPGYEDLQSQQPQQTDFQPFHVSQGKIKGYTLDQVYGDKKRGLGPLKHNCWTYWGHSGAPIFNSNGQIIGIHNSWDDRTAMRHGLSSKTIHAFLEECKVQL